MVKRLTEKQLASMSDEEFMELYRIVVLEAWARMVRLSKAFKSSRTLLLGDNNA